VVNILAFIPLLLYTFFSEDTSVNLFANWIYDNFTMVPAEIIKGKNLHTLFTSLFLHADIFHIGGFVAGMILGLIAKRKRKPKPEIPYYTEIRI